MPSPKPSKALVEKGLEAAIREARMQADGEDPGPTADWHPVTRQSYAEDFRPVLTAFLTAALDLDNAVERVAKALFARKARWGGWDETPDPSSIKDAYRGDVRIVLAELGLLDPEEGGERG